MAIDKNHRIGNTGYMSPLIIFFIGMALGGLIEVLFAFLFDIAIGKPFRYNHRFTLGKKVSFFSLPIWGLLFLLFDKSTASVLVFLFAAAIGTLLEGLMGKGVSRIFGAKIWTYKRGSIGNFTSIYSIPYWGAAGVLFATLGKFLGL